MKPEQSAQYRDHLTSEKWRKFTPHAIVAKGGKCEVCGSFMGLQVHHLHYKSLGREMLCDVKVVCQLCHPQADADRRLQAYLDAVLSGKEMRRHRQREEEARWNAAVIRFMERKHGSNWSLSYTWENAEGFYSEHLDWLDSPAGEEWKERKEESEQWGGGHEY